MLKRPDKPESTDTDDVMRLFTDKGSHPDKPLSFPKILERRKRANEILDLAEALCKNNDE